MVKTPRQVNSMRHNELTPEEAQIGRLIQSVGRHASAPDAEFLKRLRETTTSVFLEAHRQSSSSDQKGAHPAIQTVIVADHVTDHEVAKSQASVSTTIVPISASAAGQSDLHAGVPLSTDLTRPAMFATRVAQAVARRSPLQRLRTGMLLVTVVLLAFGFLPISLVPSRGAPLEVAFDNLARASSAEFEVRNGESSSVMLVAQSDHVGRWRIQHPSGNTEVFDGVDAYFFNAKGKSLHFVASDDSADQVRPDEKLLDSLNVVDDLVRTKLMRERPRAVLNNHGQPQLLYNYSQLNFDNNGTVDVEARVDARTNELLVMNTVFRDDNGRVNFQAEANVRSLNRSFAEDLFQIAPAEKFSDVATVEEIQGNPIVDAPEETVVAYDTRIAGSTGASSGADSSQNSANWMLEPANPFMQRAGIGAPGVGATQLGVQLGEEGGMGGFGGGLAGQSNGPASQSFAQSAQVNSQTMLAMKQAGAGDASSQPMTAGENGLTADSSKQKKNSTEPAANEESSPAPASAAAAESAPSKAMRRKAAVTEESKTNWSREKNGGPVLPMGSVVQSKDRAGSKSESDGVAAQPSQKPSEPRSTGTDSEKSGDTWDESTTTKLAEEKIGKSSPAKSKIASRNVPDATSPTGEMERPPSLNAAPEAPRSLVPRNAKLAPGTPSPARAMLAPATVPAPVVELPLPQKMDKRVANAPPPPSPAPREVGPIDEKPTDKSSSKMPKIAVRSDPARKDDKGDETDAPHSGAPKLDAALPSESMEAPSGKKKAGKSADPEEKSEDSTKKSLRVARGMNSKTATDEVVTSSEKVASENEDDKKSEDNGAVSPKVGKPEDRTMAEQKKSMQARSIESAPPAPAPPENSPVADLAQEKSQQRNVQDPLDSNSLRLQVASPKAAMSNEASDVVPLTGSGGDSVDSKGQRPADGQPDSASVGDGRRPNRFSRAMRLNSATDGTPEQAQTEVEKIPHEVPSASESQMSVANSSDQPAPGRSLTYDRKYAGYGPIGSTNPRLRQRSQPPMSYGARTENIQSNGVYSGNGAYLGNNLNSHDSNPNNAIVFRRRQAEPQSELRAGDVLSTLNEEHSLVRAKLANGADLVLGPQSEVTLLKPTSVQLHVGDLELNVPEGDQIELLGPLAEGKGADSNSADAGKRDVYSTQNRSSYVRNSKARFTAPPQIVTGRKIYRVENNQVRIVEESPQWLTDYHRSRSVPVGKAAVPALKPDAK